MEHEGNEQVYREGIRREPHNALYHYLLADMYLKQALQGDGPSIDKKTGVLHYDYKVTDRSKLDQGMQELAIGLPLPFAHRELRVAGAAGNAGLVSACNQLPRFLRLMIENRLVSVGG